MTERLDSHFVMIPVALCNKKAFAICNYRPSDFVIKEAVTLCNKLEMDGRRASKPNNRYHHQQQQQQQ